MFGIKMESYKIRYISEEEFDETYKPRTNHLDDNAGFSGKLFETFGPELDYVISMIDENRVVTVLECETDIYNVEEDYYESEIVYASGFHLVNRLGHFVLDVPYTTEFEVKTD